MKKRKTKYLDLYYEWHKKGAEFMCNYFSNTKCSIVYEFPEHPTFMLFLPTPEELNEHVADGYGRSSWGVRDTDRSNKFTDLRQNVILFMAAMNNEL